MRFFLLAAALAFAPLAQAQTTITTPPVAAPAPPPTAAHLAAARDAANVFLVESGAMQFAFDQSIALLAPRWRSQITASAMYQTLTPAHQQAVVNFLNSDVARLFTEESQASVPAMLDFAATRLAGILSEQDLRDIATFYRQPPAKAQYLYGVQLGVYQAAGQTPPPPPQDTAEAEALLTAFNQTPAGQAFVAHSTDVGTILQQAMQNSINVQRLRQRVSAGLCAAAGDQCPPEWRAGQSQ